MKVTALRNAFISGLLLIAPVGVTIFAVVFLVTKIGEPASGVLFPGVIDEEAQDYVRLAVYALSTLAVACIITLLGMFSKLLIGRFLVQTFDRLVSNLPFVKTVYLTVKQIVDTFSQQNTAVFQRAVLLEFPRRGLWALGFLTGSTKGETQARTSKELLNVFVPTTPNPTSGFLVMVPREEVIYLEMSVSEGMKLIISGGAVVPKYPPEPVARKAGSSKGLSSADLFGGNGGFGRKVSGGPADPDADEPSPEKTDSPGKKKPEKDPLPERAV